MKLEEIKTLLIKHAKGLENISIDADINDIDKALTTELSFKDSINFLVLTLKPKIEMEPNYSFLIARIFNEMINEEVKESGITNFTEFLKFGIAKKRINPELLYSFDIVKIEAAIKNDRTKLFNILGIQTLYDRYLLHNDNIRFESVQYFFMRVAMGIALNEDKDVGTNYAIEFYDLLSKHYFMSSTPTLFNSGTMHSQMSSCYLSTVEDDLYSIFKMYSDNAQLSKWAGGLGNDWTPVRASASHIQGTNGESQGVIPFLKVNNDTLVAVNQGGKRKGAGCAYLETWHLDILDFIELRKNTGDERRRTHDMNTSNWIPDLFMKRVLNDEKWTLFSPNMVPELHDLFGKEFETKYIEYETLAENGKIEPYRQIDAKDLWKKMLGMIFETGHPWFTFKDACNLRSPQQHVGVVHSSNLCFAGDTEVLIHNEKTDKFATKTLIELTKLTKDKTPFRVYGAAWSKPTEIQKEHAFAPGFYPYLDPEQAAFADAKYTGKKETIKIVLENGGSFVCTPEHELACNDGRWIRAKNSLDELLQTTLQEPVRVVKILPDIEQDVYDLSVNDFQNFFIKAGDSFVLVHNCTEITLNTSKDEVAVCNLGSINLPKHLFIDPVTRKIRIDLELLEKTTTTALRMLDNVIDLNFYPIPEAKNSNMRHRPVGLGLMGFQDCLYMKNYSYASESAAKFADYSMEAISYYAIKASNQLAKERGKYSSYANSFWDNGILPIDSIKILKENRNDYDFNMDDKTSGDFDWSELRNSIKEFGMRNSNVMAIAPTATISNITGVTQSIEPSYKNLFVKSNLSGEFIITNTYLINALKELDLWDAQMIDDLKYYDGSVLEIDRIPDHIKEIYQTAFEIDSSWIIEAAARRQKWIDQAQSLNLYCAIPSGKYLSDMYINAWKSGLKTTYYLRCLGATQIEKSTIDINKRGMQPRWMKNKSASSDVNMKHNIGHDLPSIEPQESKAAPLPKVCSILDGDCESCQ